MSALPLPLPLLPQLAHGQGLDVMTSPGEGGETWIHVVALGEARRNASKTEIGRGFQRVAV